MWERASAPGAQWCSGAPRLKGRSRLRAVCPKEIQGFRIMQEKEGLSPKLWWWDRYCAEKADPDVDVGCPCGREQIHASLRASVSPSERADAAFLA